MTLFLPEQLTGERFIDWVVGTFAAPPLGQDRESQGPQPRVSPQTSSHHRFFRRLALMYHDQGASTELPPSSVHGWASFNEKSIPGSTLAALNSPESSTMNDRYNVSKLLDVFITRQIASLPSVKSSGLVVNTVNPGLCVSELRKELPSAFAWFANKVARSTEYGSLNIVWAALETTQPGGYVSSCKEIRYVFCASFLGRDLSPC